jgi:cytoskeletal protein CcmA (bactofilin family)
VAAAQKPVDFRACLRIVATLRGESVPPAPGRKIGTDMTQNSSTTAAASGRSYIHAGLDIRGDLASSGLVEIDGTVVGDITAETLVIGPTGTVAGQVRARSVTVSGRLDGSISGQAVTLRSDCIVRADVTYEALTIQSGADVEGKFRAAAFGNA